MYQLYISDSNANSSLAPNSTLVKLVFEANCGVLKKVRFSIRSFLYNMYIISPTTCKDIKIQNKKIRAAIPHKVYQMDYPYVEDIICFFFHFRFFEHFLSIVACTPPGDIITSPAGCSHGSPSTCMERALRRLRRK